LVDDEASNFQVLRHTLQHDYRLLFAKDGPTALELARRERPHLILLDVMMPGMSGHDVCRALKQDPALPPACCEGKGAYAFAPGTRGRGGANSARGSCVAWARRPNTRTTRPAPMWSA